MPWEVWEPSPRDILIDRVRRGEMTPDQAEDEAARAGFGPLATQPEPVEFDPAQMAWWSFPMALAWIAWRTNQSVQEHCAEYREKCLHWVPGSWNVPTNDGTEFQRIDGYELKPLRRSTTVRLAIVESYLRSTDTVPVSSQMTISKAEGELLGALAAGHLVAVAKDCNGKVVDIPQREWPYLHLFEEQEQDVLKHDPLDREAAFTDVKLKRDDLKKLWPEFLIETHMIEPMTRSGTAGYVPLCCVLHWVMTTGGSATKNVDDMNAWTNSVARLMPLISTEQIEIIGRPNSRGASEPIGGHVFAGILVSHPLRDSFSIIAGEDPWISCSTYIDEQHWKADFNDQLFLFRSGSPNWTHLQVKKADVLREIQFQKLENKTLPVYETGAPGRPTSMQLVRLEFDARSERGETAPSITLEAAALADWLNRTHRDAPPLKAKTIKNNLAEAYRKLAAQK
jgi:hypothetical protein